MSESQNQFPITRAAPINRRNVRGNLTLVICLAASLSVFGADKQKQHPSLDADTVVWVGLDYSMVRMIGGNDFRVPDVIFPAMLEKWNTLFLDERIELVARAMGKQVAVDIGSVTEHNKTTTAKQIVLTPGPEDVIEKSHITPQEIASAVRSYKLKQEKGLGLVFIVDRLIEKMPRANMPTGNHGTGVTYSAAKGAVYVVLFDIAGREIISAKREVSSVASGANFRNFWFGPIKDADKSLARVGTKKGNQRLNSPALRQ